MSLPENRQSRSVDFTKKQLRKRYIERKIRRRRLYLLVSIVSFLLVFTMISGVGRLFSKTEATGATATNIIGESHVESPKEVPFAKVEGSSLVLYLPARIQDVCGVGYHQSFNKNSLSIKPIVNLIGGEPSKNEVKKRTRSGLPLSFVMTTRGRGTSPTSSVDVSLIEGSSVLSPVDGVILDVVPYKLYGRQDDFHIEIMAKGYNQSKIVMAHLKNVVVQKGQMVEKGSTKLATVRALGIHSQINDYVAESKDHVHIQINPIE